MPANGFILPNGHGLQMRMVMDSRISSSNPEMEKRRFCIKFLPPMQDTKNFSPEKKQARILTSDYLRRTEKMHPLLEIYLAGDGISKQSGGKAINLFLLNSNLAIFWRIFRSLLPEKGYLLSLLWTYSLRIQRIFFHLSL